LTAKHSKTLKIARSPSRYHYFSNSSLKVYSSNGYTKPFKIYNNNDTDRLDSIMLYLHENYQKRITLSEVAKLTNMSDASLMRFLKKWTGKTFIDNLNEIRVAEAVCRLTDTSDSISEICYRCGFNNLSNFNRVFKRRRGSTPTEYREKYSRSRFII